MPAKFVLSKARGGKFRFELLASNGRVLAQSMPHDTKRAAVAALRSVQKNAATDVIDDQSEPAKPAAAKKTASKSAMTKTAARKTTAKRAAVKSATTPTRKAVGRKAATKTAETGATTPAASAAAEKKTTGRRTTARKQVPATPATQS